MDFTIDNDPDKYNADKDDAPTKNTLTSSSVQRRTNYAVGIFKGGMFGLRFAGNNNCS